MVNTRHPFARLLSGWRQKFEKSFYNIEVYMRRYGRKIARSSPDGVSEAPETHHFSFEQFLNYIVNDSMENYGMSNIILSVFSRNMKMTAILDYHWQSIDYQCLPCDLRYNIIVNQETSSSDADFVTELNQVKMKTIRKFIIKNIWKFQVSSHFFSWMVKHIFLANIQILHCCRHHWWINFVVYHDR